MLYVSQRQLQLQAHGNSAIVHSHERRLRYGKGYVRRWLCQAIDWQSCADGCVKHVCAPVDPTAPGAHSEATAVLCYASGGRRVVQGTTVSMFILLVAKPYRLLIFALIGQGGV